MVEFGECSLSLSAQLSALVAAFGTDSDFVLSG
jgi:hypothetical protein